MNRVKNKVAIVTGGGKNIGKSISLLLAEEGAKIFIFDKDSNSGENTINLIKERGGEAYFIKTDVTRVIDINNSVNKVIQKFNHIDILINNVGGAKGITLDDIDEKIFEFNIDVNLKSAIFCTKAVLPDMKKESNGSIVFISSINALLGGFSEVIYACAKNGLHSLVKTLTSDYSKYGIRFNAICVGSIPDESESWKQRENELPGTFENLSKMYPLGRYGKPTDVAYATLFLASDESSWITGVTLPVDGGITATGCLKGNKWWENP